MLGGLYLNSERLCTMCLFSFIYFFYLFCSRRRRNADLHQECQIDCERIRVTVEITKQTQSPRFGFVQSCAFWLPAFHRRSRCCFVPPCANIQIQMNENDHSPKASSKLTSEIMTTSTRTSDKGVEKILVSRRKKSPKLSRCVFRSFAPQTNLAVED